MPGSLDGEFPMEFRGDADHEAPGIVTVPPGLRDCLAAVCHVGHDVANEFADAVEGRVWVLL